MLIAFLVALRNINNEEDNQNEKKIDDSNKFLIPLIIFSVLLVLMTINFLFTSLLLKHNKTLMIKKQITPLELLIYGIQVLWIR